MKRKLLLYAIITVMTAALINCNKSSDNNNKSLLLLMAANANNAAGMTPSQQQAVTSGSTVASSVSGASGMPSSTAYNNVADQQKLVAGIMENGYDPFYAREAYTAYVAAKNMKVTVPEVELATITHTPTPGGTQGNRSYTLSGNFPGVGNTTSAYPIMQGCSINIISPSLTDVGTATFMDGKTNTMTFQGTVNNSIFSGNSTLIASLSYSGFGSCYKDWVSILSAMKNPSSLGSGGSMPSCAEMQSMMDLLNYKYVIIESGDLTTEMITNYTSSSASGYSSNSNFQVTMNTGVPLSILNNGVGTPESVTLENVMYKYSSSISITGSLTPGSVPTSMAGSLAVSLSGKVNGSAIDTSISISFP